MTLEPGRRLGPYEIVEPLGAGGMGEVYRARDTRLDRAVAVKVLPSHLSGSAEFRQRFEREARAVSSLNHPHICTLHDIGSHDGVDYLVMEHLEGETLARRLERGPPPAAEATRIAVEIADALDKAHRAGLIHRDLKPGNIMLTRSGARLLDFGLAKATAQAPGQMTSAPTMTTPLTAEGTVLGTFQYMAPELLEGAEADARSDIFAFGAVVYEMLTGRRAFDGKTQASVAAAILKEEPRPMSELQPMTPPALERLVRTCLAKDPEDRWQRMHDVLLQLRWVVEGGSQAGVPAPVAARHRWREKAAWAAAAAFLLAAAALGAVAVGRGAADVRVVRAAIPPPEGTEFNLQGIQPGPVAVSPDGRRLAFAARDASGRVMLWVRPLDAAQAQMLSGTEGASYPFWSPDGKSIGFFGPGMLRKIDAAGGPATGICPAPNGKGGTWSREGVILFAPAFNSSIHRVAAGGGTSEPVTELDTARGENSHRFPQFLPDGRGFIFFVRSTGGPSGGSAVKLGELGTKETRSLMPAQSQATYASGRLLFVQDGVLMARALDPGRGAFTGDADPVVDGVRVISGASRGVFAAAEDGVLAYQQGGVREGTQLAWMDRAGTEIADVGGRAEYQNRVSISPDGRSAAVVIADASSGTPDIWTVDLARGVRSRVTFHPGAEIAPVWSPDGRRIAFSADHKEGRFDIYAVTAGGAGEPEVLFASGTGKFPSSWSPDGRHILYSDADTSGAGNLDVWALPLEGDRKPFPILRSRFTEDEAAFAPDGRWIAYMSDESGRPELYVAPFPGTGPRWQISLEGGDGPRWRRDGREIFFVAGSADLMSADVSGSGDSFVVGEVRRLPPRISSEDYDAAPDGRRFLVIPGDEVGEKALITLVLNWPGLLKS